MAIEVELKARVRNPLPVEKNLTERTEFLGPYHKLDIYFIDGQNASNSDRRTSFRLRKANESWLVTKKIKTIKGMIETNRELEFGVTDGEAFIQMMFELGFSEWYRKEKHGKAYRVDDVLIEFGMVSNLGLFVEVEVLLDDDADDLAKFQAVDRLKKTIDLLGIDRSDLESKTYGQLLFG